MKPALFLDRDGCINIDRVYINQARLMELIPGSADAIARARRAGWLVVVVTNQSGIGRGIIAPGEMPKIHARLDELLKAADADAAIDLYQICPHRPEDECKCRKPSPYLVKEAAKKLGIDLKKSAFIGDKITDVETGEAAGCRWSILLRTGKGVDEAKAAGKKKIKICADLAAAVDLVLG